MGKIRRLIQSKILKHTSSISNLSETLICFAIASFSSLLARSWFDSLRGKKQRKILYLKNTVITIPDRPNFEIIN